MTTTKNTQRKVIMKCNNISNIMECNKISNYFLVQLYCFAYCEMDVKCEGNLTSHLTFFSPSHFPKK